MKSDLVTHRDSLEIDRLVYSCNCAVQFLTNCFPFLFSPFLFFLPSLSVLFLSSFPLSLNLALFPFQSSPVSYTEPTLSMVLRMFYSIQNINLSSRTIITLSSRAAALFYFKHGLFAFHLSVFTPFSFSSFPSVDPSLKCSLSLFSALSLSLPHTIISLSFICLLFLTHTHTL